MSATVYLAGPITGLSFEGCTEWREAARERLAAHGIVGLSPMRAKDFLRDLGPIRSSYELPGKALSTDVGVTTRDRFDCQRADLVLFNFLGAERISIGTCIEVGWADAARRPMIVAMEPEGNPHDYPMIRACAGFRVESLDEALNLALAILLPYRTAGAPPVMARDDP